jgi:hypothetical protein
MNSGAPFSWGLGKPCKWRGPLVPQRAAKGIVVHRPRISSGKVKPRREDVSEALQFTTTQQEVPG